MIVNYLQKSNYLNYKSLFIIIFVVISLLFLAPSALAANTIDGMQLVQSINSLPERIFLTDKWEFQPETTSEENRFVSTSSLPKFKEEKWQPIEVPANWFLQGQDLEGSVWYRCSFVADANLKNKVIKLAFDGVDYATDVWLNGEHLGSHEGYFAPFQFLISDQLIFQAKNTLLVRVNSPKEQEIEDWSLHKRLIKGIFSHHDTRPGGAWSDSGQDLNTGGIWAPVYLQVSQVLAIEQVKVTPHLQPLRNQAYVEVNLQINHPGKTPEFTELQLNIAPENFTGTSEKIVKENRTLQPGINDFKLYLPANNPQLWWTWEHGKPNLYNLEVKVTKSGQILDQQKVVFGFRSITYDPNKNQWQLNGKRLFLRGTNYISTQWLSEMNSQKYAYDLALMQRANINAIRVHAHIEAQQFYQECDRAGILVWQDFPLQWGYVDTPEFLAEATKQGEEMINLLYNHPSIIAWSLHNEPPWDSDWMRYKYASYDPQQNKELDQSLLANLQGLDSTRYFHPYSTNKEHPWFGWYHDSWLDYAKPTSEGLITEFGAGALPNVRSLRRIFTEEELYPQTEVQWNKWEYHNFQRYETFDLAQVPMGKNPQEFIDNTQSYQVKLIKLAAQSYRLQRFQPVGAIFQFMFNEDWPSMNWGIVDYWRQEKPGYEALKIAYQPVLPAIVQTQNNWQLGSEVNLEIAVVNDLWEDFAGAKVIYTISRNWQVLISEEMSLDIQADSLQNLSNLVYLPEQTGDYELVVKLLDNKSNLLGQNDFIFTVE